MKEVLAAIYLACLVTIAVLVVACNPGYAGIGTVSPGVAGTCSQIQAFDSDGTIQKICAGADIVANIVDFVDSLRAPLPAVDAGPDAAPRLMARAAPEGCVVIPTTNVCATNAELLLAIRHVKAGLPADAGVQ